jgi:Uma2 family endonuclease
METIVVQNLPKEFLNERGEIIYPDSDGQPMADNTKQFEWIATIKGNLDSVFAQNTDVFVAGDLLWYPVEGNPRLRVAPDIMVVYGRPKGYRGSYKQWEEANIAPQVVFEILSPGNTAQEMSLKFSFYNRYGVEEYYLYDPDRNTLSIFQRNGQFLQEELIDKRWLSPLMQITFELQDETLMISDPEGKPFLTYVERVAAERKERVEKEGALKREEEERKAKEEERKAKEEERKAKEDALKQVEEEEKAISEKDAEIEKLKQLLRKSGLELS